MKLVLASASPRRVALLQQIGVTPHRTFAPNIDETPRPRETPRALAMRLAASKADAVAAEPDQVVCAADTVVSCGRRILPKAECIDEARACLALLSGRAHLVTTAVAVRVGVAVSRVRAASARVRFARLSADDMEAYIASDEWRGKAGGYAIQGRAARFAISINGSYTAIVGLPLYETAGLLRAAGIALS
jgi:septum formation protein